MAETPAAPTAAEPAVDPQDLAWLTRVHLFYDLPEAARREFLQRAKKIRAPAGGWLIEHMDPNPPFVLLQKGRAEVFTRYGERAQLLGFLEEQDHAGEEAIWWHRRSPISVRALRPTVYFRLEGPDLLRLAQAYPTLARRIALAARSHYWAREQRPAWIPAREWVLAFTRRHPLVLIVREALAGVIALMATLLFAVGSVLTGLKAFLGFAGVVLLLGLGALLWIWLEWRNDFYVITSRRAAKVERFFPFYDSRHEVPITMINAAEVETTFWGRRFGFGTVIARTWAEPPLVFVWVPQPDDVAIVLDELVRRSRAAREHEEKRVIQTRLREKLGLPLPQEPEAEPIAEAVSEEAVASPRMLARKLWEMVRQARVEHGGIITYRKHWIFLLQRLTLPILLTSAVWMFFLVHRLQQWQWPSADALGLLVFLTSLVSFLVAIYQAWDWANDIYQLTDTQILDIKAVPFGEVQRKVAPLEKVVSVDFERPSFWARVFNFGNVTIQTGPEEPLVFYRVAHPDQVQQDLFLRMEALRRRKEEAEWLRQQERFMDWLAAYHDLAQEVRPAPPPEKPAPSALPSMPTRPTEAGPSEPSWEEALGFDYDPWVTPPGIPPDDEARPRAEWDEEA